MDGCGAQVSPQICVCASQCRWILDSTRDTIGIADGMVIIPPFFCTETEAARDIVEYLMQKPVGLLPLHRLKHLILSTALWPENTLDTICKQYLHVMEVYMDNVCTMVQTSDATKLRHILRALLHAIHVLTPPLKYQT